MTSAFSCNFLSRLRRSQLARACSHWALLSSRYRQKRRVRSELAGLPLWPTAPPTTQQANLERFIRIPKSSRGSTSIRRTAKTSLPSGSRTVGITVGHAVSYLGSALTAVHHGPELFRRVSR